MTENNPQTFFSKSIFSLEAFQTDDISTIIFISTII